MREERRERYAYWHARLLGRMICVGAHSVGLTCELKEASRKVTPWYQQTLLQYRTSHVLAYATSVPHIARTSIRYLNTAHHTYQHTLSQYRTSHVPAYATSVPHIA
eukprot:2512112-Rhodomonas_salina.2